MNVYDFDDTIYDGDSSIDFYIFSVKRNPLLFRFLPKQLLGVILYKCKIITKENLKSLFFSFLSGIDDINQEVIVFWEKNENKIKSWYLKQQKEDDCIISASPFFLLKEICRRLNIINLIATNVDVTNGVLIGLNCHDVNKVIFYKEKFGNKKIDEFYSDSKSDESMTNLAEKAFIVKKETIVGWR